MASGCLLGKCPVCGDLIWEDELDFVDGKDLTLVHPECKSEANVILLRINKLEAKVKLLEKLVGKTLKEADYATKL